MATNAIDLQPAQAILNERGEVISAGAWNPKILSRFIKDEDIHGARVLDMGSNRGGLSLELARRGAIVVAAEPVVDFSLARHVAQGEGLDVTFTRTKLFDSAALGRFDVIVCFDLLFHFRNPSYVLDYISSLAPDVLYVSSQTSPGDDLKLVNRARGVITSSNDMARGIRGWQPTHAMLIRLLQASGFGEIASLTDRLYSIPEKPVGATNSAYYRAKCVKPVQDLRALHEQFEARW